MVRNDYTFLNRLEKTRRKYLIQHQKAETKELEDQGLWMYLHCFDWIDDIKEDMRLNALQGIIDISHRHKTLEALTHLNISGFTKEEAELYYKAMNDIYRPLNVNVNIADF